MTLNRPLIFLQAAFVSCLITFQIQAKEWSETTPPLNITHIFQGEINSRGKPVGFHVYRENYEASIIKRIISEPNAKGVYTAEVELYDHQEKVWKVKSFSSFFPNNWSEKKVIMAILNAYHEGRVDSRGKFGGPSGHGVRIEGWLCPKGGRPQCPDGAINTAYPIYVYP